VSGSRLERRGTLREREEDLSALYRSWGILDLLSETVGTMPRQWLEILNLARTLLEGRPLEGVGVPDELLNIVGPAEREIVTTVRTEHRRQLVVSPSDDTTIAPLRHLWDFDQITLPDLMMRHVDPEVFDFRLLSGSINGQYPVDARPSVEEWDELVEERIRATRPVRKKRQKVYALLDVSNSMREDNRMLFAKALVLAYLLTAAAEGSRVYLRTFGNTIHDRTDAVTPLDFAAVARRVLSVTPDGGTDIKRALDVAIGDIRRLDEVNTFERMFEAPPTEILLVSDCESYSVPYVPAGIKLHTVHLKSRHMMSAYEDGFARIRAESTSFFEIDTSGLLLPDTARERWLLLQDGRPIDRESSQAVGAFEPDPDGERYRRENLLTVYQRLEEGKPAGVALRRRVDGFHIRPHLPFRGLWQAVRHTAHRVAHPRNGHAAPKSRHVTAPMGLDFRVRR
jgi:hypothetical protein